MRLVSRGVRLRAEWDALKCRTERGGVVAGVGAEGFLARGGDWQAASSWAQSALVLIDHDNTINHPS